MAVPDDGPLSVLLRFPEVTGAYLQDALERKLNLGFSIQLTRDQEV